MGDSLRPLPQLSFAEPFALRILGDNLPDKLEPQLSNESVFTVSVADLGTPSASLGSPTELLELLFAVVVSKGIVLAVLAVLAVVLLSSPAVDKVLNTPGAQSKLQSIISESQGGRM